MYIYSISPSIISPNTNFYSKKAINFGCIENNVLKNQNSQQATEIGRKILSNNTGKIDIESLQPYSEVMLKPMYSVPQFTTETACIDSQMDINGKVDNIVIYIPELFSDTKTSKTLYVMNFAHEYTHYLQMKNKEDAHHSFYKNMIKNGICIPATMQYVYNVANLSYKFIGRNLRNKVVENLLGEEGRNSYEKTGGMILTNAEITQDKIAQSLGFKDAEDFKQNFKNKFRSFEVLAMKLCGECTELRDKYRKNPEKTLQLAKDIIIKYCKDSAKDEKEANITENNIAHIQGFCDRASEISYKFNALVESAL